MVTLRAYKPDDAPALLTLFRDTIRRVNSRDYAPDQIRAWASDDIDPAHWASRFGGRFVAVGPNSSTTAWSVYSQNQGHRPRRRIMMAVREAARRGGLTSSAVAQETFVMAYLFSHEEKKERERLAAIEAMGDPFTIECLEKIGVGEGWRCLEIGAGGGSITEWLCRRVGPAGKVVATDLQTKFLEAIAASNLEVRRHDLTTDSLEQESFDLVTARKVVEHLHEPSKALAQMAGAVRRGGWLLVEDTDLATYRRFSFPHPERVERGYLKFVEAMSAAGFQPTFAKRLAIELRGLGFEDVQFVCPIPVGFTFPEELQSLGLKPSEQKHFPQKSEWNGSDDKIGKVYRMTFERLRERVTTAGLLTAEEVDQFMADIQSPEFGAATGFHCATWGRKPA